MTRGFVTALAMALPLVASATPRGETRNAHPSHARSTAVANKPAKRHTAAAPESLPVVDPTEPDPAQPITNATSARSPEELLIEVQRLNSELISVRQASANALQIQAERDELQHSVINLERELESTRREKQALDEDQRQRWFLLGALVLAGGLLLGLVLPRFTWRKRSSWDSF
ncbi:MAG: TIGR04211 family SH3 domain-containing protein [Methylotetracoccus sp.]